MILVRRRIKYVAECWLPRVSEKHTTQRQCIITHVPAVYLDDVMRCIGLDVTLPLQSSFLDARSGSQAEEKGFTDFATDGSVIFQLLAVCLYARVIASTTSFVACFFIPEKELTKMKCVPSLFCCFVWVRVKLGLGFHQTVQL